MKVSIITVTLNSITTINDCINSVKEQKYNNIEHIIIDGGSTDGTLSLLESKKDQFAILVSELDKGIYDAMNKGINIATGDIIGFLNSDDFYVNENVISKIITLFKKNDSLEGCYSDLIYIDKFDITKLLDIGNQANLFQAHFQRAGVHLTQHFLLVNLYLKDSVILTSAMELRLMLI